MMADEEKTLTPEEAVILAAWTAEETLVRRPRKVRLEIVLDGEKPTDPTELDRLIEAVKQLGGVVVEDDE